MNKFVFTCGDINGIGPEIVIKALNKIHNKEGNKYFFICPFNVFEETAKAVNVEFKYEIKQSIEESSSEKVTIINLGNSEINKGLPTNISGDIAFKSISLSFDYANKSKVDGIITAPISKAAINNAGHKFPGHTEMYASWSKTDKFVMMFLSDKMKAALVTIHEPIKKIPELLTEKLLTDTLDVVINTLKNDLKISSPKIAVLGLNPHAGEEGLIGTEEQTIIIPALNKIKEELNVIGPFSPDAFFANKLYEKFDLVLGMYHDQALIPFKLINFGAGVNYTAGLPIVRTSPDHGVAYDIASKYIADESSLLEAFYYSELIVNNRKLNEQPNTK